MPWLATLEAEVVLHAMLMLLLCQTSCNVHASNVHWDRLKGGCCTCSGGTLLEEETHSIASQETMMLQILIDRNRLLNKLLEVVHDSLSNQPI